MPGLELNPVQAGGPHQARELAGLPPGQEEVGAGRSDPS